MRELLKYVGKQVDNDQREIHTRYLSRSVEETVLEIKRQSIVDLQKAVSQTEQKSNEILLREREQYQRLKAQTFEETYALLNRQEEGPEVRYLILDFSPKEPTVHLSQQCWHCARKAIETCSGCNIARYCGQYCQHRDWELHQKICGPDLKRKLNDNPHMHRYALSKFARTTSTNNPPIESSPNHLTRLNSDTNPSTPSINVSSPIATAETSLATTMEDEQTDVDNDEMTRVKNENV